MEYHCTLTSSPPSYLSSSACFITLLFLLSDFDYKLLGWQHFFSPLCAVSNSEQAVNPHSSGKITLDIPDIQRNKKRNDQNLLGDYVGNVQGERYC